MREDWHKEIKSDLSPKEKQVLKLLAAGLKNNEIGQTMCIATHSVRSHLSSIYSKLGLTNGREYNYGSARVKATLYYVNTYGPTNDEKYRQGFKDGVESVKKRLSAFLLSLR